MKNAIKLIIAVAVIAYGYTVLNDSEPHIRAKAPAVRYHGYELNRKAIMQAKLYTVLISAEGFGEHSRGTGVLIDSTHVLTCAHVALANNEELDVFFYPGYVSAKGKIVFVSQNKDLAILELDLPVNCPHYATFQEEHFDGEPITIMGNILGSMKWFVGYGIISGEAGHFLLTDGLVRGGDSGGPWINQAGEVVAISDWGLQSSKGQDLGISGGVSAKTVNQFLKSWKSPTFTGILMGAL